MDGLEDNVCENKHLPLLEREICTKQVRKFKSEDKYLGLNRNSSTELFLTGRCTLDRFVGRSRDSVISELVVTWSVCWLEMWDHWEEDELVVGRGQILLTDVSSRTRMSEASAILTLWLSKSPQFDGINCFPRRAGTNCLLCLDFSQSHPLDKSK